MYSVVETTPQISTSTTLDGLTTTYSSYTFAFELSHEQLSTLANSKVIFMRYPSIDGSTLDYDVKGIGKFYVNKLRNGAICISKNL